MAGSYPASRTHADARTCSVWLLAVAVVAFARSGYSAEWPQWRGPNRDGKSTETGLLKEWPEGGPPLIWTAKDIGSGFSAVSIKDGHIYTTGIVDGNLVVTTLDLNGQVQWQKAVAPGWADSQKHPGARSTPTIDGERLFLISGHGRLVALDRTQGDELWTVDLMSALGGQPPQWGCAESVLIDGERLICTPGGREVGMVALDKATGQTVWKGDPLETPAPYASPILVEFEGVRQFVSLVQSGLVGVEADTGRFLWRYARAAPGNRPACSDALFSQGRVFGASGYSNGGGQVELSVSEGQVVATEAWDTKEMDNQHGGTVLVDGHIYGNHRAGWSCLDFATGEQKWYAPGVGKGSSTYADGMLYCFAEKDGAVGLVEAVPTGFRMAGTFRLPSTGEGLYWAHPVVCGGRLYLRHDDTLFAYDVKAGR
jgi:outer membrane protein assembly factor BamB